MIDFDPPGESPWNGLIQRPCFMNKGVKAQKGQVGFLESHSMV